MAVLRRELKLGDLAEEASRAVPQVRTDAGHTREGDRWRRRRHGSDSGSISGYESPPSRAQLIFQNLELAACKDTSKQPPGKHCAPNTRHTLALRIIQRTEQVTTAIGYACISANGRRSPCWGPESIPASESCNLDPGNVSLGYRLDHW